MKFLGIDFGTKRVGLALSDEDGRVAFPKDVLTNDSKLLDKILKVCEENAVGGIVIGESKDFAGNPNPIMKDIEGFIKELGEKTKTPIVFEPEFLTSVQAARIQGDIEKIDASAAAIILQSHLDKIKNKKVKVKNEEKIQDRIPYEDFAKVEIKVGKILTAEKIPDTDKLLKLSVEFGEVKPRQIVSGIALYFPDPSVLVDKQCLFVTNLAPRVIRGEESDGMILALSTEGGKFSLLEPNSEIPIGTKVK